MTTLASFYVFSCDIKIHIFQGIQYFFLAMGRGRMTGKSLQEFLRVSTYHDTCRSGGQSKGSARCYKYLFQLHIWDIRKHPHCESIDSVKPQLRKTQAKLYF